MNVRVAYGRELCLAFDIPKPAEYMRNEKSECGPEARMFEQERKYAEFQ
jgi:hypothetical protein